MPVSQKTEITDISKAQLISWLKARDISPYRASQILKWVYLRQEDKFENMTDLVKSLRSLLSQHFTIRRLVKLHTETSQDGSQKVLFQLEDGNRIESVLIPERDHFTLCISNQVGCAQGCRFCLTAKRGFIRNLTPGEIIAQVRDILKDIDFPQRLSNIVLMGMGVTVTVLNYLVVQPATTFMVGGAIIILAAIFQLMGEEQDWTPSKYVLGIGVFMAVVNSVMNMIVQFPTGILATIPAVVTAYLYTAMYCVVSLVLVAILLVVMLQEIDIKLELTWWLVLIVCSTILLYSLNVIAGTILCIGFLLMILDK